MALVAVSTALAQPGGNYALTWFSISNGSGTSAAAQHAVQDVVGESIVGEMSGDELSITTSFAGGQATENLMLLYVSGDNNLSPEIAELVSKVQRGAVDANAVIYMLLDRPGDNESQLYLISKFDPGNCNLFGDPTCKDSETVYVSEYSTSPGRSLLTSALTVTGTHKLMKQTTTAISMVLPNESRSYMKIQPSPMPHKT